MAIDRLLRSLSDTDVARRPASISAIRSALAQALKEAMRPGGTGVKSRREERPRLPASASGSVAASIGIGYDSFSSPSQVLDGVYRLDELLGCGGMGEVWRTSNLELKRNEAVKLIRRDFAESDLARRRFRREARAAARLEHPNVVDVRRVGECEGSLYLVMPLLTQGQFLDRHIKGGVRLPVAEVLWIAREVACALVAAHAKGLVHRDIKPANLWLEADPMPLPGARPFQRCKVLDLAWPALTPPRVRHLLARPHLG